MTSDTFTERHGYVKKSSGLGGSIALIVGIGLLVGVAGAVGLHYAAAYGFDQPAPQGTFATAPLATEAPTATDQVETTSATLPAATVSADPGPPAPADAPKPKPRAVVQQRPRPRTDPSSDPFATQQ